MPLNAELVCEGTAGDAERLLSPARLDEDGAGTIGRDAIRTVVCTSQDDAEVCELWVDQAIQARVLH